MARLQQASILIRCQGGARESYGSHMGFETRCCHPVGQVVYAGRFLITLSRCALYVTTLTNGQYPDLLSFNQDRAVVYHWDLAQVNIRAIDMENNVSRPLVVPPRSPNPRSNSCQYELESRDDIYAVLDQAGEPLIPHQNPSSQESSQHRDSNSSIPQRSVPSSSTLASSEDERSPDQQVNSIQRRRQHQNGGRFHFLEIWWLELSSCVMFVTALAAVVITIYPYEGRLLPQWPYHLTINSLISVYIVILKAAMLLVAAEGLSQLKWTWFGQPHPLRDLLSFDDASRRPWGSLILIWALRGRQFVSRCGAFITIAALIIDPFAQQVISNYDCNIVAESGRATIPRTNNFTEHGKSIGTEIARVSLEMQRSITAGIFSPGGKVAFNCPTGNCTFPSEYHTVAYCSECNDITNRLSVNAEPSPNDKTSCKISLNVDSGPPGSTLSAVLSPFTSLSQYLVMKANKPGTTVIVAGYLSINQSRVCAETCPSIAKQNIVQCKAKWKELAGVVSLSQTKAAALQTPAVLESHPVLCSRALEHTPLKSKTENSSRRFALWQKSGTIRAMLHTCQPW
jgi:Protein of unknown function (DUF3176)